MLQSIAFTENNLAFVFWLFLCPGKSNSCTYRVAKHAEYKQASAPKIVLTRYGKYLFSTEYCLRVFFEDVSTDKKSSIFDLLLPHPEFSDNCSFLLRRPPLVLKIFQIVFSSEVVRVQVLATLSLNPSRFSFCGLVSHHPNT